jgi:GxxExxY protein
LEIEFGYLGLPFEREVEIPVYYRGIEIDKRRVDFIVAGCLLEIKAKEQLEPQDIVQTTWYLKQTSYRVALLVNFGAERIQIKRLMNG